MKIAKLILALLFLAQSLFCQAQYNFTFNFNTSGRRVALVDARVNLNTPSVTIRLLDAASNTNEPVKIYRRVLFGAAPGWTEVATVAPGVNSWTDNNVSSGQVWEYQVKRSYAGGVAIGYTCAALDYDKTNYRGRMILLLDSSLQTPLNTELQRLRKDLTGDGWKVEQVIAPRAAGWNSGDTVVLVKQRIKNVYDTCPTNDKPSHLFIFGYVPMPRAGRDAFPPDEHDENKGARGADCYYADLDGVYTDNQTYNPGNLVTPLAINLPNDYKWDQDFIPSRLEMAFGRVDFAGLTSLAPATEVDLYRSYLNRLHNYRHVLNGFFMGNRTAFHFGYDNSNDGSYRSLIPITGPDSVRQYSGSNPHPLWVKNNGPFMFYMQNLLVPDINEWRTHGMDALVFSSDQSYYGFGDVPENGLYSRIRVLQALDTRCLVTIWTTMGINIFHQPGVGETFGYSCKQIMDHNSTNNILEKPSQQYDTPDWWNRTHFAYFGDPTIRFFQVRPPTNLQWQSTPDGQLRLSWSPSPDNVIGYHIYRSDSELGIYTRITGAPVTDTFDVLSNHIPNTWYMVRAVKRQQTGSGVFLNPSQGVFVQAGLVTNINQPTITPLQIAPNPTNGTVIIKTGGIENVQRMELHNTAGQLLWTRGALQGNTVNIGDVPAGVYTLTIRTRKKTYRAQLVKE
jgi:hypothetical protein